MMTGREEYHLTSDYTTGPWIQHQPMLPNVSCCIGNGSQCGVSFKIKGTQLGLAELLISDKISQSYLVSVGVVRPPTDIKDSIFLYGIISGAIINTLGFGIGLDLQKVKRFLKRPFAPVTASCCQFILMPTLAFCLTFILDRNRALEFGVFAAGVTPGGGASNVWAFLLGGDVDLSITMTFISTFVSLAFIPLWMYTAGAYLIDDSSINLPFATIAQSLAYVVVPVVVGLLINKFFPKLAKVLVKIQRVFLVVFIVFIIIMSMFANMYAFKMVFADYQLALASMALPYVGGATAFAIAKVLRMETALARTIGIETAVQNSNIATIILRTSLPQPWADISSAIPICLTLFTPLPFSILTVARLIYLKCCKTDAAKTNDIETHQLEQVSNSGSTQDQLEKDMDDKIGVENQGYETLEPL